MPKHAAAAAGKAKSGKGSKKRGAPKTLHVVHRRGSWVIRVEGSSRARSEHATQREAVEAARALARKESASLVVHGLDGRVKSRHSYAPDPSPPRAPREVLYPTATPRTASREDIWRAVSEAANEADWESPGETGGGDEAGRSSRGASRR